MKIFGLDVPLPLVDLYNQYVTKQKTLGAQDYVTRKRRKSGKILASKSARKIESELHEAAEYIAIRLNYTRGSAEWKKFVFEEKERLKNGTISWDYWVQCSITLDVIYNSVGTSIEDLNPPPYNYRNATMKPSDVTYSNGTTAAAPMNTIGSVADNLWRDASWKWRKTVFSLMGAKPAADLPPLLWRTSGNITATATTRGSRPMFSLLVRGHLVGASSPYDTDLTPPQQPATSLYWRYPVPEAVPPYYSKKQARQAIIVLNKRSTTDAGDSLQRAIVKCAPRPMLGHGFNNNTSVQTTYDGTSELWTANPCLGKLSPTPINATITYPAPPIPGYSWLEKTVTTYKYFDCKFYWAELAKITQDYPIIDMYGARPPSTTSWMVVRGNTPPAGSRFIVTLPRKKWVMYIGYQVRFYDGYEYVDISPWTYGGGGQINARLEFVLPVCAR